MSTDEQQNRGGFVPIGELADTLPGVIQRGRAMSAQARHHFTTLRQANQLIEASEVDGLDARGLQRVALQVQRLGAVCFRDASVANQHVS